MNYIEKNGKKFYIIKDLVELPKIKRMNIKPWRVRRMVEKGDIQDGDLFVYKNGKKRFCYLTEDGFLNSISSQLCSIKDGDSNMFVFKKGKKKYTYS